MDFDAVDMSMFTQSEWAVVEAALLKGVTVAICANTEEAIGLACAIQRRMPFKVLLSYEADAEVLWASL